MKTSEFYQKYPQTTDFDNQNYKLFERIPAVPDTSNNQGLTVLLFLCFQGADLIEFDVQLTKDDIPVIYHDFKVLITYRKVISVYFNPLF